MAIEPFLGTRAQLGFLGTVVVQGIAVLALVAISFGLIESNTPTGSGNLKTVPCYLALFGFAVLYELVITLDALKLRNFIEIVGINIFHTGMIVFGALQVNQTRTALVTETGECYVHCSGPGSLWHLVRIFLIIAPCVLGASLLVMIYFTWKLYHEFGWVVFHVVGANYQMKTMFQWYQILVCLLKFDFFCFTSLTMLLLILVISNQRAEFVITIIAIPVVLVLLFGCVQAVRKEIKWLMSVSLVLMLGAQAYFLYKFARLWMPESRGLYVTTRGTVATITIISFLMLFATFAVGVRCFMDFDKGLREAKEIDTKFDRPLSGYEAKEAGLPGTPPIMPGTMSQRNSSYQGGSTLAQRVSIE